jgi:hypothetical protein
MYAEARERIIAAEIRKLERRQALERAMRTGSHPPAHDDRHEAGTPGSPPPRDHGERTH